MSFRSDLADSIAEYLPDDWHIIDYTDEPDSLDRPTVMVDLRAINPGRTTASLAVDARVFILQPSLNDTGRTINALEDALLDVLFALFQNHTAETGTATPGLFADKYPCWMVDLTFPIVQTSDPEPEEA